MDHGTIFERQHRLLRNVENEVRSAHVWRLGCDARLPPMRAFGRACSMYDSSEPTTEPTVASGQLLHSLNTLRMHSRTGESQVRERPEKQAEFAHGL